jgi:hypothetical protein
MKRCVLIFLAVIMISMPCGPAFAANAERSYAVQDDGADDIPIVIDVLILRPVGIAACVIGLAVAVVAMPFALPSKSTDKVYRALIEDPFHYTFTRPLGKNTPRR